MGLPLSTTILNILVTQRGDRIYTSESDGRQILTSKFDPRVERVNGVQQMEAEGVRVVVLNLWTPSCLHTTHRYTWTAQLERCEVDEQTAGFPNVPNGRYRERYYFHVKNSANSIQQLIIPANTRQLPNVGLMLGQRRRRFANIETTLEFKSPINYPANTRHSLNVGSMLGQRCRRWANI